MVALIHGGLYESMGARRFWAETGVVDALSQQGYKVLTPERLREPTSWQEDADHVAGLLRSEVERALPVVAGSNGCSTAARLALAYPELVDGLAVCWPVTVGEAQPVEEDLYKRISERSGGRAATSLLGGDTLRGLADIELESLATPKAVMASEPENPVHRRSTAAALRRLWPDAVELPAMPEPPVAGFEPLSFAEAIAGWIDSRRTSR